MAVRVPLNIDIVIRKGTKGQKIDGDCNINVSNSIARRFELLSIKEIDLPESEWNVITLDAEVSPDDNNHIRYITDGTEFDVGYYYMIAIITIDDNTVYTSDNRRVLQVKGRFD